MNEYQNKNVTKSIELLHAFEDDITEEELSLLFSASNNLLRDFIKGKDLYKKKSEDSLRNITEECYGFEKLAKSTKKEVNKKFQNQLRTLTENKLKEERKFGKEKNVLEEITNRMQEVHINQNILAEKENDLKIKEGDNIVRDQATFALLTSTLKVKWDFTCWENEIRGCLTGKKLVPFHINRKQHSKTHTANHLWDLIEESI